MSRGGEAPFLDAVRKVQVKAVGGDGRLIRVWIATRAGRRLHTRLGEEFWQTVLAWFSANPMLPLAEVAPLVDYIEHRRAEAPDFSIKGRSVLAMMRGMQQWHGELTKEKAASGRTLTSSGLQPMDIDRSRRDVPGNRVVEIWHVREILDSKALADEGRAMSHCVFSYARRIESGECSIFAAPAVHPDNLTPVLGKGIGAVLAGGAIFFWSWDGFMRMAIMASEVKEPRRTIPFAVVGGIAFAAVVFVVVPAATLGVLGAQGMTRGGTPNDTPLLTAGVRAIGHWGTWIVLPAAWLDTLTEAHGDLLTATRVALAMGKEHELPAWLGIVHPRFRSPHHAVLAIGLLSAALVLFADLRPALAVANVFTLVWYSVVHFDSLQLPRGKRLVGPVVTWLGLAGCLALFVSLPLWALAVGGSVLALLVSARAVVFHHQGRAQ